MLLSSIRSFIHLPLLSRFRSLFCFWIQYTHSLHVSLPYQRNPASAISVCFCVVMRCIQFILSSLNSFLITQLALV
jgi:hypothetical protein